MQDMENVWAFAAGLSEEQKIKFFDDKTKAALFDAGLLAPEDYFEPLQDIDLTGIKIPDRAAMQHVMVGDFNNAGHITGGRHSFGSMAELSNRGIAYNIVRTAPNGVVFGNVPTHKTVSKQTGERQTWFPDSWTKHDIYSAGIATANRGTNVHSYGKELAYKGVNVRILITDGRISTIAPSEDQ